MADVVSSKDFVWFFANELRATDWQVMMAVCMIRALIHVSWNNVMAMAELHSNFETRDHYSCYQVSQQARYSHCFFFDLPEMVCLYPHIHFAFLQDFDISVDAFDSVSRIDCMLEITSVFCFVTDKEHLTKDAILVAASDTSTLTSLRYRQHL